MYGLGSAGLDLAGEGGEVLSDPGMGRYWRWRLRDSRAPAAAPHRLRGWREGPPLH